MTGARRISRTAVARAGALIVRREGLGSLTVRAVAETLRVTPMALYRHVDSAAGLRAATLDHILLELASPPGHGTVVERLDVFAHAARTLLRRYPGVARAVLTEWVALNQGARIMEALLIVAAEAMPDPQRQVDLANAVFVYVAMRVIAEEAVLAGGRRRSLPAVAEHPERFPNLLAARTRFARVDTNRHFAIGLDALLAGLLEHSR